MGFSRQENWSGVPSPSPKAHKPEQSHTVYKAVGRTQENRRYGAEARTTCRPKVTRRASCGGGQVRTPGAGHLLLGRFPEV